MNTRFAGLLCALAVQASAQPAPAMQDAPAQTRTVIIHTSDRQLIAHTVVEQQIDCGQRRYALQLDRQSRRMLFIVDGQSHDISLSKVGQDFIHTASFGNYAFVCARHNIVLHFFGVQIKPDAAPVPVSYMAFLYDDGTVDGKQGFEVRDYKALDTIANPTPLE